MYSYTAHEYPKANIGLQVRSHNNGKVLIKDLKKGGGRGREKRWGKEFPIGLVLERGNFIFLPMRVFFSSSFLAL